jgi:hypothetical protein
MLLGFFIIFLISEYRYSLCVNPVAFGPKVINIPRQGPSLAPGINFEMKVKNSFSLNFELNNALFIFPLEVEVGIREYLGDRNFDGFYLYQGLASWVLVSLWEAIGLKKKQNSSEDRNNPPLIELVIPHLILTFGYKYIDKKGFTLDPFLGSKILPHFFLFSSGVPFFPVLGLYLGYSW